MWIFLNNAFLSVVDKGDATGKTLLVRARRLKDITRVFPQADVKADLGTDYRFRARIDREELALRMADLVRGIDYGNFKSGVEEQDRHDAYLKVWSAMFRFQETE